MLKKTLRLFSKKIEIALPKLETHLLDDYSVKFPTSTTTTAEEMISYYKEL